MKSEPEIRAALRQWVLKTNSALSPDQIGDQNALIEEGLLSSLKLMDLLLFIERLSERSIDPETLSVNSFHSIDAIYQNFFVDQPNES
jgi:acyl carrier protein